jgi:hypothetical protein
LSRRSPLANFLIDRNFNRSYNTSAQIALRMTTKKPSMVLIDPDVLVRIQKDIDDESAFKKVLFSLPH